MSSKPAAESPMATAAEIEHAILTLNRMAERLWGDGREAEAKALLDALDALNRALDRIRMGRAARPSILYGLRGVGKTVLLSTMRDAAEGEGMTIVAIEAPENRSLPGILVPALRAALLRLDRMKQASAGVRRALVALAGFAKLKVKYDDVL